MRAIETLDARNRRHAAEMLHAFEGGAPDAQELQFHSLGIEEADAAASDPAGKTALDWRALLPIRRKGSAHNELGILARLIWIPILFVALAGGFALLVGALEVLSNVFAGHGRR